MSEHSKKRSLLNTAALVDLKAELLRKQELAKQSNVHRNTNILGGSTYKLKKQEITKNKSSSSSNKDCIVTDQDEEEEKAFAKSRAMLEQKSRIYDEISKGKKILDEEESERYLVNFERKTIDSKSCETAMHEFYPQDAEKSPSNQASAEEIGDDWVDYVDDQGKQRRCLREDLPNYQDANHLIKNKQQKAPLFWEKKKPVEPNPIIIPAKEEPEIKGPIHYENIRASEVRAHGVGYFAFSENEEQRKQQMDMLTNMRDQTIKQRELRQRMKEKRSAMLSARLAKVKQRKQIVGEDQDEENKISSSDESVPLDEIPLPDDKVIETEEPRIPPQTLKVRPWDKGKDFSEVNRNPPMQQTPKPKSTQDWFEKRRTERQAEFAPPEIYSKEANPRSPWTFSRPANNSNGTTTQEAPPVGPVPASLIYNTGNGSPSLSPLPSFPGNFWQQPAGATASGVSEPYMQPLHANESESNQWSNVVGSTDPSGTVLSGDNMNPEEVSRIISEGLRFFRNQT